MKITIKIKAAFEDTDEVELENILQTAVFEIANIGERAGNLKDSHGNTVGKFKVTGK